MSQNEDGKEIVEEKDIVIDGASAGDKPVKRGVDYLPKVMEMSEDPVLYEAWRNHMITGFKQNNLMFKSILNAFMRPYNITVAMYVVMFLVGIGGFVASVAMAATSQFTFAALFGGMSVVSFLTFFVSRPLRSLEKNLLFITWLGVIYNTYWTRLMYANDQKTVNRDLEAISKATIAHINELVDKHNGKTPAQPPQK